MYELKLFVGSGLFLGAVFYAATIVNSLHSLISVMAQLW